MPMKPIPNATLALGTLLLVVLTGLGPVRAHAKTQASGKPRLVMVNVDHWRVRFFGLPRELPMLWKDGQKPAAGLRQYDFTAGQEAMEVYLQMRPQSPQAEAYRRFLGKWPLYQEFFKAVDNESVLRADTLLQQIRQIDPQEPAVHFYQGSLDTQRGRYAEAEREYLECLKYYPEYGLAYIHLARLARARGAEAEAKTFLEKALTQSEGPEEVKTLATKMLDSLKP